MTSQTTELELQDLLTVLLEGPLSARDERVDPLLVVDMMDNGLVDVSVVDATVTITDKGRSKLAA